jgi:hypothetical protein
LGRFISSFLAVFGAKVFVVTSTLVTEDENDLFQDLGDNVLVTTLVTDMAIFFFPIFGPAIGTLRIGRWRTPIAKHGYL